MSRFRIAPVPTRLPAAIRDDGEQTLMRSMHRTSDHEAKAQMQNHTNKETAR